MRKEKKGMSPAQIVYGNKAFLVLNKEAGIVTLKTASTPGKITLQHWLKSEIFPKGYFSGYSGDFAKRFGIVHRLDKETSGLILVAKKPEIFINLQNQFKKREVEKEYWLLAIGDLPRKGSIIAPIARSKRHKGYFSVLPEGKRARTDYRVVGKFKKGSQVFSLVKAFPETGRTHQIRVHFRYLGYPILGDLIYGPKTDFKPGRLCLHSWRISFFDPVGEKNSRIKFEASLPEELNRVLKELENG